MFEHPDFERYVFWYEDLKETLQMVHREANNHSASDFKSSELILQDFINRYVDPSDVNSGLFENGEQHKMLN